jgi:hypothetical protein
MTENYEKDFVPKKQALALKKLGFDESCLMAYLGKEKEPCLKGDIHNMWHLQAKDVLNPLKAPTFSQAFRYFREKHNLKSCIMFRISMADNEEYYDWLIKGQEVVYRHFKTYEEAELACLKNLIEIVKQQL